MSKRRGHTGEPCKNGGTDRDAVCDVDSSRPQELYVIVGDAHWRHLAKTIKRYALRGDAGCRSYHSSKLLS